MAYPLNPNTQQTHRKWNLRSLAIVAVGLLTLTLNCAHAADVLFKRVADGVYAFVGDIDGRTFENEALNANFGLVVTQDGLLLIDSGASFKGAQKLAAAAQLISPLPIKWVINTGGQDHRWQGNGFFKSQGAQIIAHINAQADMRSRGLEQLQVNAAVLKEKMQGTELVMPDRWLNESDTILLLGTTKVQIIHRNGGHTPGDSMVWLADSGVVFTGDIVYVERMLGMPPVSKSKEWLASFNTLVQLQPKIVVPGHGRVTDLKLAQEHTGNLLSALRKHMGEAIEKNVNIHDARKSFNVTPFMQLKHAEYWLPRLTNHVYLEMELE
jgi:glyoxylase-like metal-dependent hydrolase (beta-lactamase superfamily II)